MRCEELLPSMLYQPTRVADEETRRRKLGNLLRIADNHLQFVVSLDPIRADEDGIRHLSLHEFLLLEM
jgi:hypothetical protein